MKQMLLEADFQEFISSMKSGPLSKSVISPKIETLLRAAFMSGSASLLQRVACSEEPIECLEQLGAEIEAYTDTTAIKGELL